MTQPIRYLRVGILDKRSDGRDHARRAHRNHHAQLAQHATYGVNASRSLGQPPRTNTVQCGQDLLFDGLDRHRPNDVVAHCLQQCLGIGAVGLVPANVGMNL
jgi:hypothetical protein